VGVRKPFSGTGKRGGRKAKMCGRGIGALNNFKVVSNYARNFIKTGQSWWKQRSGASMERQTLLLSLKRKIRNIALGKNVIVLAISPRIW